MSSTAGTLSPDRRWRINPRKVSSVVAHGYIWIWLLIFALPFVATTIHSLEAPDGGYTFEAYRFAFGTFKSDLLTSFKVTGLTILINLLISVPAAYGLVRFRFPGKQFLLSTMSLSLYTPGAVMGISLAITYAFLFDIPRTLTGLVGAYVVGTFPLMLVPLIVALKDLPPIFEEAARTLGASRLQSLIRIELPLLGPGISAGILLTFVIIFNEFLVTLFIAGPGTQTAALRVYNLTRTAGFLPTTAALAAIMQLVSFVVVLAFFKFFGSRYLKGTYLI